MSQHNDPKSPILQSGLFSGDRQFGLNAIALTDKLIISVDPNYATMTMANLDEKGPDGSIIKLEKIVSTMRVEQFNLSADRSLLAVLNGNQLFIWPVANVKSAADFREIKLQSLMLPHYFQGGGLKSNNLFFIGSNSHIVTWEWRAGIKRVSIIDCANEQVREMPYEDFYKCDDLCPLGANRILSVHKKNKLCVEDFKGEDGTLSKRTKLIKHFDGFISSCCASQDGRLIAVCYAEDEKKLYLSSDRFMRCWELQSDNRLQLLGNFPCQRAEFFKPFFTAENALVFPSVDGKTSVLEFQSQTPRVYDYPALYACALPNGNLLAVGGSSEFRLLRSGSVYIYQQAFAFLMHALEVSGSVKEFSGDLTKMVVEYLGGDSRFFAKPLAGRAVNAPGHLGILERVMDRLLSDAMISEADKVVMRSFLVELKKGESVLKCVENAASAVDKSLGLTMFLEDVRVVFTPDVGKKLKA